MGNESVETDEQLIKLANLGDGHAFGTLYVRHRRHVMMTAFRSTGSLADAEDVTAMAFLETWRKRASIRFVNESALPWILTVTINVARNHARAARRYAHFLSGLPEPANIRDHADDVAAVLDEQESRGPVWAAFVLLNEKEQAVLTLCALESYSEADAARALGIPVGTLKSRLSRAKERMRVTVNIPRPVLPTLELKEEK